MAIRRHQIYFMVPPQVHLLDLTGPAHVFYEAIEYGAILSLHFVAMDSATQVKSTAGLTISDLKTFDSCQLGVDDWIFVPGLDWACIEESDLDGRFSDFLHWLNFQASVGVKICSVCTGTFLLAKAGILQDLQCTTHWKYLDRFRLRHPEISVLENRLFVKDKNVYSSAGVSSGMDLSLFILEELFGANFAQQIAREIVIYMRRTDLDPQLSIFLNYRNHVDTRIHDAQDFMASTLNRKITISEVAESVNMSDRNFTRLFKKITGITMGEYLERLRVDRAKHLLADGFKMTLIARECGLKSTNQLRSILRKYQDVIHTAFDV